MTQKALKADMCLKITHPGHETTAAVLTWTLHLLADHPDVTARIRAEVSFCVCSLLSVYMPVYVYVLTLIPCALQRML